MNPDARPVSEPAAEEPQPFPVVLRVGRAVICTRCYMRKMTRILRTLDGALSHLEGKHRLRINGLKSLDQLARVRITIAPSVGTSSVTPLHRSDKNAGEILAVAEGAEVLTEGAPGLAEDVLTSLDEQHVGPSADASSVMPARGTGAAGSEAFSLPSDDSSAAVILPDESADSSSTRPAEVLTDGAMPPAPRSLSSAENTKADAANVGRESEGRSEVHSD